MVHQYEPNFPHRLNKNGFYESICTLCNLTIASARHEAQLRQYEQGHTCSPVRLVQVGRYPYVSDATVLQR
jgi:hypothetical protein